MTDPWATQQQPTANPSPQQQTQQPAWPQPGQQGQQPRGPQPPSLGDALAGGGKAAFDQYTPVGIAIRGTITKAAAEWPRVGDKFWDDGNPKWIIEVHIENAEWSQESSAYQPLRTSAEDDGKRVFYIKRWGPNFAALLDAIKATGQTDAEKALAPGTMFAGKHTGRQKSSRGGNDELLYAYHIGGPHTSAAPGPTGAMPQPPVKQTAPPAPPPQQPSQPQQPWPQPGNAPQEEPPF